MEEKEKTKPMSGALRFTNDTVITVALDPDDKYLSILVHLNGKLFKISGKLKEVK